MLNHKTFDILNYDLMKYQMENRLKVHTEQVITSQRDLVISNDVLEWTYGANPLPSTNANNAAGKKDLSDNKNGKKINKKLNIPGPKIVVNFSGENDQKTLLGCFFGDPAAVFNFKSEHFQYRPVISRNHNIKEVKEALFNLDVKELVSNSASDQIHVWMKRLDSSALSSISVDDPEQACKLFNAGHSLYCRAPPHFEEIVVPKLIKELSYGIDPANNDRYRRGEVEVFYSRKGHFTDFHTDFQENFTIQLAGVKKWIFGTSTASHPLRGCTPHFNDEKHGDVVEQQLKVLKLGDNKFSADQFRNVEKLAEVILKPGDVMYHPAGIWHRVECIDDSISINISLTAVSYADVFCSSLQQLLMENPLWRSSVFHEDRNLEKSGRPTAVTIMRSMIERVPELVKTLEPGDLLPFPTVRAKITHLGDIKPSFFTSSTPDGPTKESKGNGSDSDSGDEGEWEEAEDSSDDEKQENDGNADCEGGDDGFESIEDDSDERSTEFVIRSNDVNIVAFIESLCLAASASNESDDVSTNKRKTGGLFHEFASLKVKFNPFAVILTDSEIKRCTTIPHDQADDYEVSEDAVDPNKPISFVVHTGYGNETLESAARATVHFPGSDAMVLEELLKFYHQDRERRILHHVRSNRSNTSNLASQANIFTSNDVWCKLTKDKKNRSLDLSEVVRIIVSLHLAGAITILPN